MPFANRDVPKDAAVARLDAGLEQEKARIKNVDDRYAAASSGPATVADLRVASSRPSWNSDGIQNDGDQKGENGAGVLGSTPAERERRMANESMARDETRITQLYGREDMLLGEGRHFAQRQTESDGKPQQGSFRSTLPTGTTTQTVIAADAAPGFNFNDTANPLAPHGTTSEKQLPEDTLARRQMLRKASSMPRSRRWYRAPSRRRHTIEPEPSWKRKSRLRWAWLAR